MWRCWRYRLQVLLWTWIYRWVSNNFDLGLVLLKSYLGYSKILFSLSLLKMAWTMIWFKTVLNTNFNFSCVTRMYNWNRNVTLFVLDSKDCKGILLYYTSKKTAVILQPFASINNWKMSFIYLPFNSSFSFKLPTNLTDMTVKKCKL